MIFTKQMMAPLFMTLEQCKGVAQMDNHHPEGDVFVHSLQVLNWAFRETEDTDLILAAMLHDVGKLENSHGHEKIGIGLLNPFISTKTAWLITHHMRIWTLIMGEMKKLKKVKDLAGHPWLPELVLLARWDKLGRDPKRLVSYNKEEIVDRLNKCVENRFK
jgi:HD superfamily phosphohydrolase